LERWWHHHLQGEGVQAEQQAVLLGLLDPEDEYTMVL